MDSFIRESLKDKTVGIAGAGGLGSNIAMSLARIGIGKIIIIDFDIVEKSNLNRQYFFLDQIDMPKVEGIRENILKVDPNINVESFNERLTSDNLEIFQDVDILLEAFDDPYEKANLISNFKVKYPEIPIVAASGIAGYGPGENVKITQPVDGLWLIGDETATGELFIAPMVGIIANQQANLAIRILLGGEDD